MRLLPVALLAATSALASTGSVNAGDLQPPSAPTQFSIDVIGPATWVDTSVNEDGFRIYVQLPDREPRISAEFPANTTSGAANYTFLENCSATFWVVAFNAAGESGPSNSMLLPPPPSNCPFSDRETYTNNSGVAADKLILTHIEGWYSVTLATNAPSCDEPTIVVNQQLFRYEVTWPTVCVDPGESVEFEIAGVGPTFPFTNYQWLNTRASPSQSPSPSPSPSPPAANPSPVVTAAALPQAGGAPGSNPDSGAILAAGVILVLGGSLALKRIR